MAPSARAIRLYPPNTLPPQKELERMMKNGKTQCIVLSQSCGAKKGTFIPKRRPTSAISISSMDRITRSINAHDRAASNVQASSGFPYKGRLFFRGIPFAPREREQWQEC
jgi:hypothetical protein